MSCWPGWYGGRWGNCKTMIYESQDHNKTGQPTNHDLLSPSWQEDRLPDNSQSRVQAMAYERKKVVPEFKDIEGGVFVV